MNTLPDLEGKPRIVHAFLSTSDMGVGMLFGSFLLFLGAEPSFVFTVALTLMFLPPIIGAIIQLTHYAYTGKWL